MQAIAFGLLHLFMHENYRVADQDEAARPNGDVVAAGFDAVA